jgi:hypothetical protein
MVPVGEAGAESDLQELCEAVGDWPMKKHLTLSEKIFRISREAAVIQRKGVGENPGNDAKPLFAYARMEDVSDVVNPLLQKYKLLLTGSVPKEPMTHTNKAWATTEVMVEWTLKSIEIPTETLIIRIPGTGVDDQGKGIYKALTGSRKYANVFFFNLKFGDEPEEVKCQDPQSVTLSEL